MSDTGAVPRRLAPPPPPARPTSAIGHSSTPNTLSVSHSASHPGRAPPAPAPPAPPPPPARTVPPPSRMAPPSAPPTRSRVQSAVSPSSTEGEAPSSAISPIGFGAPPLPPGRGSHGRSVSGGGGLGYPAAPTLPPPRTSSYGGIGGVMSGGGAGAGERRSAVKGPVKRSK
jgi:hypothetical protein